LKAFEMSNLMITSGSDGSELSAVYMEEKNLGAVGGAILETCSLENFFVCRCKNTRDRTPVCVGSEAGEAATPVFAADYRADTPTVFCRFLERK
jgi:hypothetical protein